MSIDEKIHAFEHGTFFKVVKKNRSLSLLFLRDNSFYFNGNFTY